LFVEQRVEMILSAVYWLIFDFIESLIEGFIVMVDKVLRDL
jgi:hypothetical protein